MRTNMHYDMVFVLERKYDHLAKFIRRNFRSSNSWVNKLISLKLHINTNRIAFSTVVE